MLNRIRAVRDENENYEEFGFELAAPAAGAAVRNEDESDEELGFELAVPAAGGAVVRVFFDAARRGLESLFGPRPGLAQGFATVLTGARELSVTLAGAPPAVPPELCVGARQTLVVLDAPETRRPGDEGRRLVCVQVPVSYATGSLQELPVTRNRPPNVVQVCANAKRW